MHCDGLSIQAKQSKRADRPAPVQKNIRLASERKRARRKGREKLPEHVHHGPRSNTDTQTNRLQNRNHRNVAYGMNDEVG